MDRDSVMYVSLTVQHSHWYRLNVFKCSKSSISNKLIRLYGRGLNLWLVAYVWQPHSTPTLALLTGAGKQVFHVKVPWPQVFRSVSSIIGSDCWDFYKLSSLFSKLGVRISLLLLTRRTCSWLVFLFIWKCILTYAIPRKTYASLPTHSLYGVFFLLSCINKSALDQWDLEKNIQNCHSCTYMLKLTHSIAHTLHYPDLFTYSFIYSFTWTLYLTWRIEFRTPLKAHCKQFSLYLSHTN